MNAKKTISEYHTPPDTHCPECGELCQIIALDNSVDVAPTHCTHGLLETWYPENFGDPVTSCCHFPLEGYYGNDYEQFT